MAMDPDSLVEGKEIVVGAAEYHLPILAKARGDDDHVCTSSAEKQMGGSGHRHVSPS